MYSKTSILNLLGAIISVIALQACSSTCSDPVNTKDIDVQVEFIRLDQEMFQKKSPKEVKALFDQYPDFAQQYLQIGQIPDSIRISQISQMIQDPYMDTLHQDVQGKFGDLKEIKDAFIDAFKHIKYYYPEFKAPKVYTVITGLGAFFGEGREFFVTKDIIVCSLDFFIGPDAKYPPKNIPEYILRRYHPQGVVPECIRFMSNGFIQVDPVDQTLLADMIFYGKANHFVKTMMPCLSDSILYGYTEKELARIDPPANRNYIWNYLVEKQLLFSNKQLDKRDYMDESPYIAAADLAGIRPPGRIGRWFGTRIIQKYADKNKEVSFQELMANPNAREIFTKSGYQGD